MGEILDATRRAIAGAGHLTDMDQGAVETLLALALKIDMQDAYFQELAEQAAVRKLRPPAQDNVSIPTYLKFCDSLGLTPAGRLRLDPVKTNGDSGGSKLARLRAVHG